jgi:DnaJ-domain-containing protein 1
MSRYRSEREEKLLEEILSLMGSLALRTNRTKMVEVDLTTAHTDEAVGLEASGRVYRWLTIERCDDSLNYKLKQTDGSLSDIFRAYESARISQHDFLDIIVSNPAGTGICRFVVGFWED